MKVSNLVNWFKNRPIVTVTAAFLLIVCVILLPTVFSPAEDDKPDVQTGTLRNPTAVTEDAAKIIPPAPTDAWPFVPAVGDFTLSVPGDSAGQIYALPTSSAVLLNTKSGMTAEDLQSALTVTREMPITVSSSGDGFLITPAIGT